ncbi:MAG TPA: prepilin-type N-terminal cleavage/methylation domain-containing protein [Phycisphaerae bacterium]|nr:prepilin-type N-terminal cleavage/methylation domain-containing protein [Phycisphaerae bacterium]
MSVTPTLSGLTRRRGFTLAELVASMAVMSILMVGLGSAILIASHALPDDKRPATRIVESAAAVSQLVEELRSAIWIRERTATSVEFSVPDRDGDGNAERIRYAWSGTAGDALTRQYNAGTVINVVDGVNEFDLAYDLQAVTEEYPGAPVEGSETLLMSYENWDDKYEAHVHDNQWWAEYFKPSFPVNAVSWRVSRVWFVARRDHADDTTTKIQLRLPGPGNMPSDTIIDEVTMKQLSLTDSFQWVEKSFSDAGGLSPSQGLCLTFITNDANSALLWVKDKNVVLSNAGLIYGNPGWQYIATNQALLFYIYGTVSTPGPPQTATRYYVTAVRVALQAGSDSAARVVTTAQTLNRPELLSGLWEADFDSDPTLDHNGDGKPDWVVHTEGSFNPGSLSGGVWSADQTLDSYPNNDFTQLTTVELRFRSTGVGQGPVFRIASDWSESTYGPMFALLQLQADATQTLTLYHQLDATTPVVLLVVPGLSSDFVTLRLLIDPNQDTVNVKVNGHDHGTYIYNTFTPSNNNRFASVGPSGGAAQFAAVSVRVGE